jgi:hypothetical protein
MEVNERFWRFQRKNVAQIQHITDLQLIVCLHFQQMMTNRKSLFECNDRVYNFRKEVAENFLFDFPKQPKHSNLNFGMIFYLFSFLQLELIQLKIQSFFFKLSRCDEFFDFHEIVEKFTQALISLQELLDCFFAFCFGV